MRRQVGADDVDLDTEEGYARYTLRRPQTIDFAALEEAAHSAGYTTIGVELLIAGRSFTQRCDTCEEEVILLEIPETGQRFELDGQVPLAESVRIRGSAFGWGGDHARLKVLELLTP